MVVKVAAPTPWDLNSIPAKKEDWKQKKKITPCLDNQQVTCFTCNLSVICVDKLSDCKAWDSFSSWSWVGNEGRQSNFN